MGPNESIVRFIVMYTIKENHKKNLRESFRTMLIEEFNLDTENDKLNESAYQIHETDRTAIFSRLNKIIQKTQIEEPLFDDDFIDLYCSGIVANYGKRDNKVAYQNIIQHRVFPSNSVNK